MSYFTIEERFCWVAFTGFQSTFDKRLLWLGNDLDTLKGDCSSEPVLPLIVFL